MKIVYITNARLPTEKAHGVQIIKMIEALSSLNNEVILISPKRIQNEISHKTSVFNFYNVKNSFKVTRIKKFNSFLLGINYYLYSLISFFKAYRSSNLIIQETTS